MLSVAATPALAAEFVEVQTRIQMDDEVFAPLAIVELGRTADIKFKANNEAAPSGPSGSAIQTMAPSDSDIGVSQTDHRILLTINRDSGGYDVRLEYMTRPNDRWVSQWAPRMFLNAKQNGSLRKTARSGEMSEITISIEPRHDVASFADLRSSYFYATGPCDNQLVAPAAVPSGGGVGEPIAYGAHQQQLL